MVSRLYLQDLTGSQGTVHNLINSIDHLILLKARLVATFNLGYDEGKCLLYINKKNDGEKQCLTLLLAYAFMGHRAS